MRVILLSVKAEMRDIADRGDVLFGKKVLLRPFTEFDIDPLYIGWLNDPDVVRFSNQRFLQHDHVSSMNYLSSFDCSMNIFMSVRQLADDRQVGTMTAYVSRRHGTVDIGIMIGDKAVWGHGYGQEAWGLLTNWLLEHTSIRKLTAGTLACNFGMIKIIKRSGMVLEAVRKSQEIINEQPVDMYYFAKFHAS